MEKLERLTQDKDGFLYMENGSFIGVNSIRLIGKIKTFVVQNPCLDFSKVIDEIVEKDSRFANSYANAYVVSDFNSDTQHIKEEDNGEKVYSTYAVQFYKLFAP